MSGRRASKRPKLLLRTRARDVVSSIGHESKRLELQFAGAPVVSLRLPVAVPLQIAPKAIKDSLETLGFTYFFFRAVCSGELEGLLVFIMA